MDNGNNSTADEPCRFRWNGDDHTGCPNCGGTGIDPNPIWRGIKGVRSAALVFLAQFDAFMEDADVFPDDLAEARKNLVEALDD